MRTKPTKKGGHTIVSSLAVTEVDKTMDMMLDYLKELMYHLGLRMETMGSLHTPEVPVNSYGQFALGLQDDICWALWCRIM